MIKNPIGDFPGYQLRIVSQKIIGELYIKLQTLDLRLSDSSALIIIKLNPGILQSQVGEELHIARANMAPIVAKLHKKGLISKRREDGRSFGLYLTSKGEEHSQKILEIMTVHEEKIFQSLSPSVRDLFFKGLSEISQAFNE